MEVDVENSLGGQRREVDLAQGVDQVRGERRRSAGLEVQLFLLIAVLDQQPEQLRRAGQPAERDRAQLLGGGVRVQRRDDLRDAGHDGLDPHDVTGLAAGDEGAQPELVGARGRHVAPASLGLHALVVERRGRPR